MEEKTDLSEFALQIPDTDKKRIIIIGGGFGGLNFIKNIPENTFQLVLFDKHNYHTFLPLLYQVATSALEAPSICDAHRRIYGKRDDLHFRAIKVLGINDDNKEIETFIGNLHYDYLIIACGSVPNFFGNENLMQHSFPLKSLPNATALRTKIYQNLERATLSKSAEERKRLLNFVIVGGGPTGVEVAGALSELRKYVLPLDYKDLDFSQMHIKIVEGVDQVLVGFSSHASDNALATLKNMDVEIVFNTLVTNFDGNTITYKNGDTETCGMLIWGAGVSGALIKGINKDIIKGGKYIVDTHCRVKGYDTVFAIGDIALFQDSRFKKGLPGVAQPAIQQGKYTAKLIYRMAKRRVEKSTLSDEKPFHYLDKGSLATIGRNKAVADLPGNLKFSGFFAWILWAGVHLFYLNGLRNRLFTFLNWMMNYFNYQNKVRLILNPSLKPDDIIGKEFAEINETGE